MERYSSSLSHRRFLQSPPRTSSGTSSLNNHWRPAPWYLYGYVHINFILCNSGFINFYWWEQENGVVKSLIITIIFVTTKQHLSAPFTVMFHIRVPRFGINFHAQNVVLNFANGKSQITADIWCIGCISKSSQRNLFPRQISSIVKLSQNLLGKKTNFYDTRSLIFWSVLQTALKSEADFMGHYWRLLVCEDFFHLEKIIDQFYYCSLPNRHRGCFWKGRFVQDGSIERWLFITGHFGVKDKMFFNSSFSNVRIAFLSFIRNSTNVGHDIDCSITWGKRNQYTNSHPTNSAVRVTGGTNPPIWKVPLDKVMFSPNNSPRKQTTSRSILLFPRAASSRPDKQRYYIHTSHRHVADAYVYSGRVQETSNDHFPFLRMDWHHFPNNMIAWPRDTWLCNAHVWELAYLLLEGYLLFHSSVAMDLRKYRKAHKLHPAKNVCLSSVIKKRNKKIISLTGEVEMLTPLRFERRDK